jgi:AcrR family transcriptional regulator
MSDTKNNTLSNHSCGFKKIKTKLGIRQQTKAARPNQILEAALQVFCDKGYHAARIEDIAKKVCLSKASVYVYYPTKIDLFLAVALKITEPLGLPEQGLVLDPDRSAQSQMREVIQSFYSHSVQDETTLRFLRLMIAESGRVPEIAAFHAHHFIKPEREMMRALIKHGVLRGEFDASVETKLLDMEDILVSPSILLVLTQILTGRPSDIEVARWQQVHWDMVINLLKSEL